MIPFFMRLFVASILFFTSSILHAKVEAYYTADYKKAFSLITQLRFEEADLLVKAELEKNPDNKVGSYLKSAMICAEIFANEDQQYFGRAQDQIDGLMEEVEEIPPSNPYRNLFLGEIYLAQATLNGKFKNNIKAAWQFYKAYDLLTENAGKFPDFMPNKIPLGVLYAGIGSLPDDYRSLASLLGFDGSVQGGIAMVKEAFWRLSADENLSFYRPYAGFVYSYITYQLGADQIVSPDELGLDVVNSSFLIFAQTLIDLQAGKAQRALQWLDQRPRGEQYFQFAYMDYLQGKILLGLDPDRSTGYFQRYLQTTHSQVYVKSTYRYLCWYYLLSGNESRAAEMKENIFRKGNTNTGADRQALEEANLGFNKTLVQARVFFDVALYKEAELILTSNGLSKCCKSEAEKAEYHYRYGRIKQEMGASDEAIKWFTKALEVHNVDGSFALGNSALQLAALYEGANNKAKAIEYYKRALKYSGYPFYEGVHQKAKTGLARLRN